jgi:hypothetical protein
MILDMKPMKRKMTAQRDGLAPGWDPHTRDLLLLPRHYALQQNHQVQRKENSQKRPDLVAFNSEAKTLAVVVRAAVMTRIIMKKAEKTNTLTIACHRAPVHQSNRHQRDQTLGRATTPNFRTYETPGMHGNDLGILAPRILKARLNLQQN